MLSIFENGFPYAIDLIKIRQGENAKLVFDKWIDNQKKSLWREFFEKMMVCHEQQYESQIKLCHDLYRLEDKEMIVVLVRDSCSYQHLAISYFIHFYEKLSDTDIEKLIDQSDFEDNAVLRAAFFDFIKKLY